MIIDYPIFGAGRGKVGGLVGYPKGTAQVFRHNNKPILSQNQASVNARIRAANAAPIWYALDGGTQDMLRDYCKFNEIGSAANLVMNAYNLRSFSQVYHQGTIDPFNPDSAAFDLPFENSLMNPQTSPNWSLYSEDSFLFPLSVTGINWNRASDVLEFDLTNTDGNSPFSKLWNNEFYFGLLIVCTFYFSKLSFKRNLVNIPRAIFNNPLISQACAVHDFSILVPSPTFPLSLATAIKCEFYLIDQAHYNQRKIIASVKQYL